jgi:hypothetical protein
MPGDAVARCAACVRLNSTPWLTPRSPPLQRCNKGCYQAPQSTILYSDSRPSMELKSETGCLYSIVYRHAARGPPKLTGVLRSDFARSEPDGKAGEVPQSFLMNHSLLAMPRYRLRLVHATYDKPRTPTTHVDLPQISEPTVPQRLM